MASLQLSRALTRPQSSLPYRPISQCLSSITHRSFSQTPSVSVKAREHVQGRYGNIPAYPYGYRRWYKKSNFGLFGNTSVRFGNNVSKRNEIKTRRRWYPNVHRKRLYSVSLGRMVRVKVVTRVMRTIDKVGGLDEYLLGEKAGRIKELGPGGWALRWRIMRTDSIRERLRLERERLGLPPRTRDLKNGAAVAAQDVVVDGEQAVAATQASMVDAIYEEDAGIPEAELKAREEAIDRALDEDLAKDEQGLDGGVELESLEQEVQQQAEQPQQPKRRKW